MLTEQQINEIKENGLFDFIGNNYWKLDKETLKDMFKEFNFAVYEISKKIEKEATDKMLEEMKEIQDVK